MDDRGSRFPLGFAWIVPAAGVVTVVLGVWGWLGHRLPFDEALYRAVALFEINNDAYAHGVGLSDWRFRVGRWTGAGAVITGLLALATLLRQHLATSLARWTRQQVVVVGGAPLAPAAFERARRSQASALWLGAPGFESAGLSFIALAWPASDRAAAVRIHAHGAEKVLVADEDDARGLAHARAARAAAPASAVTLLMREASLAEDAAAALNDPRTRVLSTARLASRALMLAHPPFLIARDLGHPRAHVLIVGFGQTGQAIGRELIVNGRTTYLAAPRLSIVDPDAAALEGALRVRAPELDACAECVFVGGEISGRAVRPGPAAIAGALRGAGPITTAYVCLADDAAALSAAAMLHALLRNLDVEAPATFVRLRDAGAFEAGKADGPGSLIPFGDIESVLAASEFLEEAPDAAARAFCEAYRANLPPAARDDPSNRSAFAWDRLDETYRQANRDAVAHIPAKLASAGVDPARWRGVSGLPRLAPGERLFKTEAELETLAALEHERWMAQRRMDGWRSTESPVKDEARRLHPALRPYAELAEDQKEFDRAYVRQTWQACRPEG